MTKLNFALVLVGSIFMSSCALNKMVKKAKDQQLEVNPSPLEVHADKVNFEMSAVLPSKMLPSGKVYTLKTFYQYDGKEEELEDFEFTAADYPNNRSQASRSSKEYSFDYTEDKGTGQLYVQGVASDPKNGKSKSTDKMPVEDGVGLITTSKLVKPVYFAAYADHGYNNQEELIPNRINFFFEQGSSVLRTSEKRSDRGSNFQAFIAEKNVTRTVTITGTHSPEGTETINSDLAKDRAEAIEKYYRQNMARYDYKGMADSIKFVIKPVIQDWNEFKKMLASYDGISSSEKSEYTKVIDGSGTFEEKEKSLQKLPTYKKVFNDIYPELRTAKTEILTVKDKKTDAQIAVLSKQLSDGKVKDDTLSTEELMYGATLTPSLAEREAIFKAATKKSDKWQANNNLGAVYLAMAAEASNESNKNKHVESAVTQLEIAKNKQNAPEVNVNLAVAYMMQGNNEKALDAVSAAVATGNLSADNAKGASGVKGSLEIMNAKYDMAVKSQANAEATEDNLFNRGLALLLNKDFQNAKTAFNDLIEKNSSHAMAHYGAAIASARLKREGEVLESLKAAVSNDPKLKEKALNDLEFYNYKDAVRSALN